VNAARLTPPAPSKSTSHPSSEYWPRLSLLGHFLGRHVDDEARGFAADITRKNHDARGEGDQQRAQGGRR
jgi:hypothetical protein